MTFTAHPEQIYSASTQRPFPSGLAKQTNESPHPQRRVTPIGLQRTALRGGETEGSHTNMASPAPGQPRLSSHDVRYLRVARTLANKSASTPTFTTDLDLIWPVRQEGSPLLNSAAVRFYMFS